MKLRLLTALFSILGGLKAEAKPIVATASWYGREHHGKIMANGRPFNMHALTLATWDYPLGTYVRVDYIAPGGTTRSVVCQVTDRGPHKRLVAQGRRFDLSWAAFKRLESPKKGLIQVKVTPIPEQ